jgi:SNF2 family DNA or RNA helicase
MPFQRRVIERMLAAPCFGAFLSPGAGKTGITLAVLEALKRTGQMRGALVIAPQRPLRKTWRQEGEKWGFDLSFALVHGTQKQRLDALFSRADVYLINPENVAWLAGFLDEALPPFDVLVVDESQRFKNSQTQRYKALQKLLPRFRRRYCLSGTPAAEGLMDLYAQIRLLDNGKRLGRTLTAFRDAYCVGIPQWAGYMRWELREGADREIQAKIADICYRLDAADYIEMPDRRDNDVRIESRATIDAERAIFRGTFPGLTSANEAAKITSARQASGGAVYLDDHTVAELHHDKLDALADLVDEQQGDPILIAVAFRHEIPRVAARLKKVLRVDVPHIAGGVSSGAADRLIESWNAGKLPALIVHPGSVSTGLNLQAGGRAIVWYSLPWSLDEYIQTNARVWRQGQRRGVIIHHLIVEGSIDEVVLAALRQKGITQEDLYHELERYGHRLADLPAPADRAAV